MAGFERPLGFGLELRVEAYRRWFDRLLVQRAENDVERAARLAGYVIPPDLPADSALLERRPTVHPENGGHGSATGIELLVQRTGKRVGGWIGYAYSKTVREAYGYRYRFDFDRPHTLSAVASVRLSSHLRLSTTVLAASGFPITPLYEEVFFAPIWRPDGTREPILRPSRAPDGTFRTSPDPLLRRLSLRNTERLGSYARADVRVTYATGGRWEFYGEVINVFGTRNYLQTMPVPTIAGGPQDMKTKNNVYENFERFPAFGVRVRF